LAGTVAIFAALHLFERFMAGDTGNGHPLRRVMFVVAFRVRVCGLDSDPAGTSSRAVLASAQIALLLKSDATARTHSLGPFFFWLGTMLRVGEAAGAATKSPLL